MEFHLIAKKKEKKKKILSKKFFLTLYFTPSFQIFTGGLEENRSPIPMMAQKTILLGF